MAGRISWLTVNATLLLYSMPSTTHANKSRSEIWKLYCTVKFISVIEASRFVTFKVELEDSISVSNFKYSVHKESLPISLVFEFAQACLEVCVNLDIQWVNNFLYIVLFFQSCNLACHTPSARSEVYLIVVILCTNNDIVMLNMIDIILLPSGMCSIGCMILAPHKS